MGRAFLIAAALLLLAAGIAMHGRAHGAERQVIRLWYSLPAPYARIMDSMIDKYLKQTPYRVTVESANFETQSELCEALLASPAPPHLALIDSCWQSELIEMQRLVCAEEMMDKVGSTVKTVYKLNTYPSAWKGNLTGGKAWTVPFYMSAWALLYNKATFAANKIAAPPATWAETVALGKKLTKGGAWGFYLPLSGNPRELSCLFQEFVWQAGGDDLCLDPHVDVGPSSCSQALGFWVDAVAKHRIAPSAVPRDLARIAMLPGTQEDYLRLEGSGVKVGVARLPRQSVEAPAMQIVSLAIFAGHEKMQDKVRDFTFFLTKSAQYVLFGLNCPYLPASVQLKGDPVYIPYMREHPGLTFFYERIIPNARPAPFRYRDGKAVELLGTKIQETLRGETSLEEALAALKAGAPAAEPSGGGFPSPATTPRDTVPKVEPPTTGPPPAAAPSPKSTSTPAPPGERPRVRPPAATPTPIPE